MLKYSFLAALVLAWPILGRQHIVQAFPNLHEFYQSLGLDIRHSGNGLTFEQIKTEIKYDGGTQRLIVDGVIHNATKEAELVPDIKARALGPDRHIIQSWWVPAPAATVAAESNVPFHTEVNASSQHTIDNVYLEFYTKEESADVAE